MCRRNGGVVVVVVVVRGVQIQLLPTDLRRRGTWCGWARQAAYPRRRASIYWLSPCSALPRLDSPACRHGYTHRATIYTRVDGNTPHTPSWPWPRLWFIRHPFINHFSVYYTVYTSTLHVGLIPLFISVTVFGKSTMQVPHCKLDS